MKILHLGVWINWSNIDFFIQIPGGKKFDSAVVNGFVCTKNIAHKKVCVDQTLSHTVEHVMSAVCVDYDGTCSTDESIHQKPQDPLAEMLY